MKNKMKKPVIISALVALGLGAATVGTTFALFTDRADTKIDVVAGVVDLDYKIELVKYENEEGLLNADYNLTNHTEYTTETNTEFKLSGTNINVSRMIPGDKLTVKVTLLNKSNVKTKWRFTSSKIGELAPALTVTGWNTEDLSWHNADAVENIEVGTQLLQKEIVIAFPNHDEGILAREEGIDNQYQGKEATIKFAAEMVQGNAAVKDYEVIDCEDILGNLGKYTKIHNFATGETELKIRPQDLNEDYFYLDGNVYRPTGLTTDLRFVHDANGALVVDNNGFVVEKGAENLNLKEALLSASGTENVQRKILLPIGTITPVLPANATKETSVDSFNFDGVHNLSIIGSTYLDFNENGKRFYQTSIDTEGYRYKNGLTYHEMAFENCNSLLLANINFTSTRDGEDVDKIENGCNSKTYMFFRNDATINFNTCNFELSDFSYNEISRAVFDIRGNTKYLNIQESTIKSYTNGAEIEGVGICMQTIVSVNANYEENGKDKESQITFNYSKIIAPDKPQTRVYSIPGYPEFSLAQLAAVPAYQNKVVAFYLSNYFPFNRGETPLEDYEGNYTNCKVMFGQYDMLNGTYIRMLGSEAITLTSSVAPSYVDFVDASSN